MRANFMVEKAANGNRGGLAIQATEAGVSNNRDLYLQPAGGRVGILKSTPTEALHVGGSVALFDGVIRIQDGSNAAPALTFANDTDTGILRVTTNALGITAAGSRKFYVNATNAYFQNLTQVQIDSGNFYVNGQINASSDFRVNGTVFIDSAMNAQNLNVVQAATGSDTAPNFRFTGDTDTGMSRSAANTLNLITGGATRIVAGSNGYVGIGTTTLNKFFNLADPAQGGEQIKLHFEASSGADKWAIYSYDRTNNHYTNLSLGQNAINIKGSTNTVGIGSSSTNPTEALEVYGSLNATYQSNNFATGAQRGFIDMINSSKIVRVGSTSGAATASGDQGAIDMTVNSATKTRFDVNGNVAISSHGNAPNNTQKTNTSITASQSTGNSWTATSGDTGTYVTRGNIEVAGIYNRHVMKFGFSGNLVAQTYYPFVKRSELTSAMNQSGSSSEDGFAMYFRLYTYLSTVGIAEYGTNRLSNMIWINNFGSNSTQTHYFNFGPGFGHAPNTGDSGYGETGQYRLRVKHRMGSDSTFPSDQTFEIFSNSAMTGLNPSVVGRQFLIYGYLL